MYCRFYALRKWTINNTKSLNYGKRSVVKVKIEKGSKNIETFFGMRIKINYIIL